MVVPQEREREREEVQSNKRSFWYKCITSHSLAIGKNEKFACIFSRVLFFFTFLSFAKKRTYNNQGLALDISNAFQKSRPVVLCYLIHLQPTFALLCPK
jgi:hypothetical protein